MGKFIINLLAVVLNLVAFLVITVFIVLAVPALRPDQYFTSLVVLIFILFITIAWTIADDKFEHMKLNCEEGEKYWREVKRKHYTLLNLIEFINIPRVHPSLASVVQA